MAGARKLGWDGRSRLAASLVAVLACLTMPACKRAADAGKAAQETPKPAQQSRAQARPEETLVQQAASNCRQRIQEAARTHASNAKQVQEAKVLDMEEVTQREQLEAKRAVVRKFLVSNQSLKSLLVNEEAVFTEELAMLKVPPARAESALKGFQSGIPGKAVALRMRETDQRIGSSLLSALDFLEENWGQWNYNKEYDQVQFSPPGALKQYLDFMAAIEAASKEQQELQAQSKAAANGGP